MMLDYQRVNEHDRSGAHDSCKHATSSHEMSWNWCKMAWIRICFVDAAHLNAANQEKPMHNSLYISWTDLACLFNTIWFQYFTYLMFPYVPTCCHHEHRTIQSMKTRKVSVQNICMLVYNPLQSAIHPTMYEWATNLAITNINPKSF